MKKSKEERMECALQMLEIEALLSRALKVFYVSLNNHEFISLSMGDLECIFDRLYAVEPLDKIVEDLKEEYLSVLNGFHLVLDNIQSEQGIWAFKCLGDESLYGEVTSEYHKLKDIKNGVGGDS